MPRPNRAEDIVRLLAEQGGAGVRAELAGAVSASALRSAESRGWVTHLGNGSVVLARLAVPPLGNLDVCRSWTKPDLEPSAAEAEHITSLLAFARGSRGILSHRTAAPPSHIAGPSWKHRNRSSWSSAAAVVVPRTLRCLSKPDTRISPTRN